MTLLSTPAGLGFQDWLLQRLQSSLGCGPIRPEDNFFDLGGDSMTALNLFTEIEEMIGCRLPLTIIYDAPEIGALAQMIMDETSPGGRLKADQPGTSRPLLIKPGPKQGAVFLIHGIGGHVFDLAGVASLIETRLPVFALRALGLDPQETPLDRVEVMADDYLACIRTVSPAGPYVFIGYSFGGLVALEMARRLLAAGEPPALLVLMDSYPHPRHWPRAQFIDVRWRRMWHQAQVLRTLHWQERLAYCRTRLQGLTTRRGDADRPRWLLPPPGSPPEIQRVFAGTVGAVEHYDPHRYEGAVTFIKPTTSTIILPDNPRAVWHSLLPDLRVEVVAGDHATMLETQAPALAQTLSTLIAEAEPRH